MRRYLPGFLLALVAFAPVPLVTGCDLSKLKGGGADAGIDAAALIQAAGGDDAAAAAVQAAVEAGVAPPLGATTGTPLVPGPTPVPTVKPVDGGKVDAAAPVADAGAVKDGGPAPTPTPTLTIPSFDAGALKNFDAGGFKPPWQH